MKKNLVFLSFITTVLLGIITLIWPAMSTHADFVEVDESKFTYQEDNSVDLTYENYKLLSEYNILDEQELTFEEWVYANSIPRENEFNSDEPLEELEEHTDVEAFSAQTFSAPVKNSSNLMKGDILISNGTSSAGLTGHAAIVVGRNQILHIWGPNYSPNIISYATWEKYYGLNKPNNTDKIKINTEVYRIKDKVKREAAADWVVRNYWNKNADAKYGFGGTLMSTNPTYCSKIVWQGYYSGPSSPIVNKPIGLATPYGLPTYFHKSAGLSLVFKF